MAFNDGSSVVSRSGFPVKILPKYRIMSSCFFLTQTENVANSSLPYIVGIKLSYLNLAHVYD